MNYTKIGLILDCGGMIELGYNSKDEKDIMRAVRQHIESKDCLWIPDNYGGQAVYNGRDLLYINMTRIVGICELEN